MNGKTLPPKLGRLAVSTLLCLCVAAVIAMPARALETSAKQAILIDIETGTVLLEKNADEPVPPSSMSKMMTVYVVFERLKEGTLSLSDTFVVSRKAWKRGGSKMFVEVGKSVSVGDLLRGVIVQSGNDAAIVLAEGLAGDEKAFADRLNEKAKELGLTNSHFKNASGWPEDGHLMSVRDIARLSINTIRKFPELYKIYAEKTFTFSGIRQGNRNPLLYKNIGADGLKTGHTESAGYGLSASAVRDGRRLVLVLNGLPSMRARSTESHRLMSWGFREFRNFSLYGKGDEVATADVWLGAEETVPLVIDRDLKVTLPRGARKKASVKVVYTGPIPAPIAKDAEIAHLEITASNIEPIKIPLKAGKGVERLGFMGRVSAGLSYLLWGTLK
ncbi:MAG: D-alanyl-D-alanine carboxypeptidase [Alphaproteobacteria bacterium]|nr:D-alanyl-D-alanine carboxypeptidase [Alphaproteobacteria bacterium]